MIEQVPNNVNVLSQEIREAATVVAAEPAQTGVNALKQALNTNEGNATRLAALKLAVKMMDPDSEAPLLDTLVLADALVRYIVGIDRHVIGMAWRDAMLDLHQQRETPFTPPDQPPDLVPAGEKVVRGVASPTVG